MVVVVKLLQGQMGDHSAGEGLPKPNIVTGLVVKKMRRLGYNIEIDWKKKGRKEGEPVAPHKEGQPFIYDFIRATKLPTVELRTTAIHATPR